MFAEPAHAVWLVEGLHSLHWHCAFTRNIGEDGTKNNLERRGNEYLSIPLRLNTHNYSIDCIIDSQTHVKRNCELNLSTTLCNIGRDAVTQCTHLRNCADRVVKVQRLPPQRGYAFRLITITRDASKGSTVQVYFDRATWFMNV